MKPSRPLGSAFEGIGARAVVCLALTVLAMLVMTSAEAVAPSVPGAARNLAVSVSSQDSEKLFVSWEAPASDGGSPITGYKIQYKFRHRTTFDHEVAVSSDLSRLPHSVAQVTNGSGREHTVRVVATNAVGDGPPSAEVTATPLTPLGHLRAFIEMDIVQKYGAAHPWLRKAWEYMNRPGFQLSVANPTLTGLGQLTANGKVTTSCVSGVDVLMSCRSTGMTIRPDAATSARVIVHEMAHVYTDNNGLIASPAPLGVAHVYLDRLPLAATGNVWCGANELIADLLTISVLPDARTTYWHSCNRSNAARQNEALVVVRSALGGQMPAWFGTTYGSSDPDLERFWSHVKNMSTDRQVAVHHLRNAFGGYCSINSTNRSAQGKNAVRNPWRDGGCVPQAPGNVAAISAGNGNLSVSWHAPDGDGGASVKGYKLQWKSGTQDYDTSREARIRDPDDRMHVIEGLSSGTEFTLRMVAYNANGDGAWTGEASATPNAEDARAPTVSSATVAGTTLTLHWNEPLDTTSVPATSTFTVNVSGTQRGITGVAIADGVVTLTLATAVKSVDAVTVSYTPPTEAGVKSLRDVAENNAAAFSNRSVANETVIEVVSVAFTSDPGSEGAYSYGETIEVTVTFSENVTVTGTPELIVFGWPPRIPYHGGSGSASLTFRHTVEEGDKYSFGFIIPAGEIDLNGGTIRSGSGQDAELAHEGLAAQPGHRVDVVPPTLASAVVNGNAVTLTFNEALDETRVPTPVDSFTLVFSPTTYGGHPFGLWDMPVTGIAVRGTTVTLTMATPVASDALVRGSYTVPDDGSSAAVTDTAGNEAQDFYIRSIDNVTPGPGAAHVTAIALASSPGPYGAYGIGDAIDVRVTFSESVTVDTANGTPTLVFKMGSNFRLAHYSAGSGTQELTFRYTVREGNADADGVSIPSGGISLHRTMIVASNSGAAAATRIPEMAAQSGHLVETQRPTLSSTSVDGDALTLTFSEALDEDSVPPGSSFTVSVAGSPRPVDAVVVSEKELTLTLSSAVVSSETVTVGYTVPTGADATPVKDAAGNPAATFANAPVTNATAALPVVSIVASTTPVTEGTTPAFTLSRTEAADAELTVEVSVTESGAALSGTPPTQVTFAAGSASATLSVSTEDDEAVEDASTVTATVSSGTGYTVDGSSGSAEVVVEDDDVAPVVTTGSPIEVAENATAVATLAATDEDTAVGELSWSIPSGADGGADGAKFALTAGGELTFGSAKDYEAPDDADTDGEYEVTVRVTDGSNPVDAALVVRLSDVDDTAPTLSSASVDGDALTLTFSEALDGDSEPAASTFAVTVAGSARTVDAVAVSEKVVTLTLSSAVVSGETVTVGYTVPTGADATPVKDVAGNSVATFANAEVTNATATLPVVSIVASTTPVTEGTAAAFTLSRTEATDAELTVEVSVSESEAVVSGTPPTQVTFAAESSTATLNVATEDDEAVEDASTVTVAVSSGTGYTVDGSSGSAEVVVEDDDAAPVVTTGSPIEVAENATAVATLAATDEDTAAGELSWSIPSGADGGADGAKFALTAGGELTFGSAKDYEAPDDADTDGEYEVTVRVTDGSNPVDAALVVQLSDVRPTARFEELPKRHDGTAAFRFQLHFSPEPAGLSYKTVGGGLLEVTGATVNGARRLTKGSNLAWVVTAEPTQTGDVVISLPVRPCSETSAICIDGEPLAQAASATVPGPVMVSIVASTTPVTEGTAAAFTLSRTEATDAELTVEVSVTESGAALSGTPPTQVTFAAGSASATLSVSTEDDEAVEDASTVTATVSSGTGYTVDGSSGSAEVVVEDDDVAPVVTTGSPIEVAENATAVATLAATDEDTAVGELSWSIPSGADGGADGAKFALTAGGELTFGSAKDYEAPDDADTDGEYEVTVRVTDGSNPVDAALVVRLSDVDDTAPTLSSASVDGDALTLTFSEALDGDSEPAASTFAVTVAGSARTVDAVAVSEKVVTLTLSSAVVSGETVTVGYTVPTGADATPVKDVAGNSVATFANAEVTNATATLPVVSIVASTTPVTEGTAAAFTLSRTEATDAELTVEVSVSESEAVVSGTPPTQVTFAAESSTATLNVATEDDEAVEDASTVTVAVSSGTGYTVDGSSGSAEVVVEDDDAAPVVTTGSPIEVAENATAVATLAATDEDTAAADLAWSLAGGADRDMFTLSEAGVLAFKAAKDFESPDDADSDGSYEVTVRVTDGANPVDAAVTVELADVDDGVPVLSSASVNEDTLTLGFDEALDSAASPASDAFSVKAGEAAHSVSTVSVSGSSVTLTLASAVPAGETVTVSYTAPTGDGASPLQDALGNPVAAFSDRAVTNATASRVSIAASSPAVTEGRAAAFTLRRTGGDTTVALTVAVSVSEAGSVLSGTPDSSVTFAAGATEATLSVATENDAVDEADGTVTVTVSSGSDYTLDPDAASARVGVYDNDAATVTTLWSSTLKWTAMNDLLTANAKDFTSSGWSEDGDDFGIWYLTYEPFDGLLWLRLASPVPAGGIPDPGELTLHVGGATVEAGAALSAFAAGKIGTANEIWQDWEVGDRVSVRLTRTGSEDTSASLAGISVEDATVGEADGVPLSFSVTLGEAQTSAVSVRYATSDGTAVAGQDYEAVSGVLRFEPGQTSKTVSVEVFADEHNEGSETMTLTLSSPFGATMSDATATGTITNTGPIPQAWLARFGRTVADQVLDAVDARLHTARAPGVEATVAGQALSFDTASEAAEALAARRDDEARAQALSAWLRGEDDDEDRAALSGTHVLSERDLFTGTAFALTGGTPGEGTVSAWGRGVISNFDGRDGELTLDGEVGNLMLGADFTRGRATAGLMLSHARGRGGYEGASTGSIEASLTGLYPYGRYAVSERVSVWGTAGYGEGTLTVEPEGEAALETDMDLAMASVGVRGVLVKAPAEGGAELAVKSDAMAVRTTSDAVRTSTGNLAAAKADVTRLRVGLEGSRSFRFDGGASLVPSVELGMRHDGGDAETGFGADIGAGLAWSDPARGLSADARARGLLTHEDGSFSERGFAGSLAWDPAPGSARGPSLSLSQTVGAEASGGVEALLRPQTAQALEAADDDGSVLERRTLEAKAGYGFALFDGRYTGTPELGFGMSDAVREVVLGWRLAEETRTGLAFGLDVEGARQESVDDGAAGHRLTLGFGWRLEGAGAERFELRFEGARIEAANDGEIPEQRLGLSLTARW